MNCNEEPPQESLGRDESGQIITNFAENSDRVIYQRLAAGGGKARGKII